MKKKRMHEKKYSLYQKTSKVKKIDSLTTLRTKLLATAVLYKSSFPEPALRAVETRFTASPIICDPAPVLCRQKKIVIS